MKRVMCAFLALVLVLGVTVLSVSANTVKYGDVNRDGKINNRDLGALQQYVNGFSVDIDVTAADVRPDGKVNNRDLGLLQQYVNGFDVTLGPEEPEVPAIELPAAGYDFDGRERIIADSIVQDGNTVIVTVHNHTTQWLTEETSCVLYTCTDAEGNVLYLNDRYYGTLYLGMLEAGEIETFTITLPEGTAKLEFGDFRIVYWSQWA